MSIIVTTIALYRRRLDVSIAVVFTIVMTSRVDFKPGGMPAGHRTAWLSENPKLMRWGLGHNANRRRSVFRRESEQASTLSNGLHAGKSGRRRQWGRRSEGQIARFTGVAGRGGDPSIHTACNLFVAANASAGMALRDILFQFGRPTLLRRVCLCPHAFDESVRVGT